MIEPVHIISLGAGVQSSTKSLMAKHGEITPMPFMAGFCDTQNEPAEVYTWLDWLESQLPFPVWRGTKGNLATDSLQVIRSKLSGKTYLKALIPAFVLKPNGDVGIFGRKCTSDYKIEVLARHAQTKIEPEALRGWRRTHKAALKEFGLAKKQKRPCDYGAWMEMQDDALIVLWLGISTDEASRMKPNRRPWIRNRYPLIEKGFSRTDCKNWMRLHGYSEPPRSACTFCPFHDDTEWVRLRDQSPLEFAKVVQFERKLIVAAKSAEAMKGIPYLHRSCVPIDQVVFKPFVDNQPNLFENECEGMCGV